MAVITGDLYKGFTFGGISSKAYGVYITQEASFDAPEKDVETFEIAGRNGAYILDNGRFRNISISYKCGIAESTETDFATVIRSFRSALSALAGKYVRLTDDYNANEYREAAFFGGFSVEKEDRRAGEFTVTFDAKPQRFLTSGETAVSVASGDTITNPTLFDSKPLLQVWGYGDIGINGEQIEVIDAPIGDIVIANGVTSRNGIARATIQTAKLNRGDSVTTVCTAQPRFTAGRTATNHNFIATASAEVTSGDATASASVLNNEAVSVNITAPFVFQYGTAEQITVATTITITGILIGGGEFTDTYTETTTIKYNGSDRIELTSGARGVSVIGTGIMGSTVSIGEVHATSTKGTLGEPLYFDMDLGEAYKEEDGEIVSVNNAVSFPAELPTLKAGGNVITYDSTITRLDVVPRWWEV